MSEEMELDLTTKMTLVVPGDDTRGGSSYAASVNNIIKSALRKAGYEVAVRQGWAVPDACTTDVYRMEIRSDCEQEAQASS
jgi:hypothetical protein